jgi:hypothetical protein
MPSQNSRQFIFVAGPRCPAPVRNIIQCCLSLFLQQADVFVLTERDCDWSCSLDDAVNGMGLEMSWLQAWSCSMGRIESTVAPSPQEGHLNVLMSIVSIFGVI